ncbi:uncharacterized protein LOC143196349 [Rhynchophorus ferrugineus]|uniref:uncharacterized protein LOC143196349 n=1 Tax=Rhynchophorus ferrugineus TaxID=354439 RepID=UPI003FCE66BE
MPVILATVRARSEIAVAVAYSGIAAKLLEGCCMAHLALKLPLNLLTTEQPTCNIAKHSVMAAKIIVWDECTMAYKRALEALDKTLKDVRNDSRIFAGANILLSGDFRQTLPTSTAADEINACLKSSNLWCCEETSTDSKCRSCIVQRPSVCCRFFQAVADYRIFAISSHQKKRSSAKYFRTSLLTTQIPNGERAILTVNNKDVDGLKVIIQNQTVGTLHSFKSIYCVLNEDEATNYPSEFLSSLDVSRLAQYNLHLKASSFPIRLAFAMMINKSQGQSLTLCGLN